MPSALLWVVLCVVLGGNAVEEACGGAVLTLFPLLNLKFHFIRLFVLFDLVNFGWCSTKSVPGC